MYSTRRIVLAALFQFLKCIDSTDFAIHTDACGGVVEKENGTITSPSFPHPYPPNEICIWDIKAPEHYRISLIFTYFDLDGNTKECGNAVVAIHGKMVNGNLKKYGVFCSSRFPPLITSEDNFLRIIFSSGSVPILPGSVAKTGFRALFLSEKDECATDNGGCQHICKNTIGSYACSCHEGFLLGENLHNCKDEDECATNNGGCQQICKNTIGSYVCSCQNGFIINKDRHTCTKVKCGGVIEDMIGIITSPSFPNYYPPDTECNWEIIVPPQYKIVLNFTHFDLEESNSGSHDHVKVYSKLSGQPIHLGKFCGSVLPRSTKSIQNSMIIRFTSNNLIQRSGFRAFFYTVPSHDSCNHRIVTSSYNEISSHNYTEHYPNGTKCSWLLITKPGQRIKLTLVFKTFDLEIAWKCFHDKVKVYDGGGDGYESLLLGTYCGGRPPPILTSGNRMYLVFESHASVQEKGYKASFEPVCGGRLLAHRNKEHFYSHAKYGDENYDNNVDCDWIVQGLNDMRVKLRFLTFEVEHEQDCGFDYVEIYDGKNDLAKSFGKFCGNKTPPEFYSSGNSIMVRFRSDITIGTKGFSASYVALDSSMYDNDDLM